MMKARAAARLCLLFAVLFFLASSPAHSVRSSSDEECSLCKRVVGLVEDFAGKNATEDALFKFLENDVCPLLVKEVPLVTCQGFVMLYGPYVIHVILTEETPTRICEDLRLCVNSTLAAEEMFRVPTAGSSLHIRCGK
jgi:Saposin-like type B, region 1/Saposin-like type B, region 2